MLSGADVAMQNPVRTGVLRESLRLDRRVLEPFCMCSARYVTPNAPRVVPPLSAWTLLMICPVIESDGFVRKGRQLAIGERVIFSFLWSTSALIAGFRDGSVSQSRIHRLRNLTRKQSNGCGIQQVTGSPESNEGHQDLRFSQTVFAPLP
jgi:hypothetical protein